MVAPRGDRDLVLIALAAKPVRWAVSRWLRRHGLVSYDYRDDPGPGPEAS